MPTERKIPVVDTVNVLFYNIPSSFELEEAFGDGAKTKLRTPASALKDVLKNRSSEDNNAKPMAMDISDDLSKENDAGEDAKSAATDAETTKNTQTQQPQVLDFEVSLTPKKGTNGIRRCQVVGCSKNSQPRREGFCCVHYNRYLICTGQCEAWHCQFCGEKNASVTNKCGSCLKWKSGKHPMFKFNATKASNNDETKGRNGGPAIAGSKDVDVQVAVPEVGPAMRRERSSPRRFVACPPKRGYGVDEGDSAFLDKHDSGDTEPKKDRSCGRPRKDSTSGEVSLATKRNSGRQSKHAIVSKNDEQLVEKNRGRPRNDRSAPNIRSKSAPVPTRGTPVRRGLGRRRMDGSVPPAPSTAFPVEEVGRPVSRGRGRPRKDGNASIPMGKEAAVSASVDKPVERGRKRPRKGGSVPDLSAATLVKNDGQPLKRRRGRSRNDTSASSPRRENAAVSRNDIVSTTYVSPVRIQRSTSRKAGNENASHSQVEPRKVGINHLSRKKEAVSNICGQVISRGRGRPRKDETSSRGKPQNDERTPIPRTFVSKIHGKLQLKRGTGGPKNDGDNTLLQNSLKPIFEVGAAVYAAYWPANDKARDSEPSWYPGVVSSYKIGCAADPRHGSVLCYKIQFNDGDLLDNILDYFVFASEDYLLNMRHGGDDDHTWLGVRNVTDETSKDGWARHVGWYVATIDGVKQAFSLLSSALRAYDSSVYRKKGLTAKDSDLNLPEESPRNNERSIQE